jgi:hypothetical protein
MVRARSLSCCLGWIRRLWLDQGDGRLGEEHANRQKFSLRGIPCAHYRSYPGTLVAEATRRFTEEGRAKMFTLLTRVPSNCLDKRDYYIGYAIR